MPNELALQTLQGEIEPREGTPRRGVLASVGAAVKAVASVLPYAGSGGSGGAYGGGVNYVGFSSGPQNMLTGASYGASGYGGTPNARKDWSALAGDLLNNTVVAACVARLSDALAVPPATLEEKSGTQWKAIDHPCISLLNNPTGDGADYSGADMWGFTIGQEITRGACYWVPEFNASGEPIQLRLDLQGWRAIPGRERLIEKYVCQIDSREVERAQDKIIHFRPALSPWNPRDGYTALRTGAREIAGDNAAAEYNAALLDNAAVMSLLLSLGDSGVNQAVTGPQWQEMLKTLRRDFQGGGAGRVGGFDFPVKVDKVAYSPDEMQISSLIAGYEYRICALIGIDPMVLGLGSGTQQKTYANLAEALTDFWERGVVPRHDRHASQLTAQYLPLWKLDIDKYRIRFDYAGVPALSENTDALYGRIGTAYKTGLLDLKQARAIIKLNGEDADEAKYEGVFYKPPSSAPLPAEPGADSSPGSVSGSEEMKRFDHNQPRDEEGKWTVIRGQRVSITGKSLKSEKDIMDAASLHDVTHEGRDVLLKAFRNSTITTDDHLLRAIAHAKDVGGEHTQDKAVWEQAVKAHGNGGSHEGRHHWRDWAPTDERLTDAHNRAYGNSFRGMRDANAPLHGERPKSRLLQQLQARTSARLAEVEHYFGKALAELKAEWNEAEHPRADNGEFGSGGASVSPLSEKAQRAKDAHKMVDKTIQRYAEEHNEPRFAQEIGGKSYNDSEPVDVGITKPGGGFAHGIELKTMVDNKNNKITMKSSAMAKKKAWQEEAGAPFHTVVLDDHKVFNANGEGQHDESKRQIYYKRGAGSFRVDLMHPVKDQAELKQLLDTPDAELPKAAQPSATWKTIQGVASKRPAKG